MDDARRFNRVWAWALGLLLVFLALWFLARTYERAPEPAERAPAAEQPVVPGAEDPGGGRQRE